MAYRDVLLGNTKQENYDAINQNVEELRGELATKVNVGEELVQSVNLKTGAVQLTAQDVSAVPVVVYANNVALNIDDIKETGVYSGEYQGNIAYLVVIKYNNGNIYQRLIGSNYTKYRRFATIWSGWKQEYSTENPVTASDVTGITSTNSDVNCEVALLNNGTFYKSLLTLNPLTGTLKFNNSEFASKTYVDNAVNMIHSIVVQELPAVGVPNTIYYVPTDDEEDANKFNEYTYVDGEWELLGATQVDLTPFLTKDEASLTYATKVENATKVPQTRTINGKALSSDITLTASDVGAVSTTNNYVENTDANYLFAKSEREKVATSGNVVHEDDISDFIKATDDVNFTGLLRYGGVNVATASDITSVRNAIPTKTSDLTNDSNFVNQTQLNAKADQSDLEDLEDLVSTKASQSSLSDEITTRSGETTALSNRISAIEGGTITAGTIALSDEVASVIELSINSSTYVITATLKDAGGNVIDSDTVDLPIESVVVSGSYDSVNQKIVLTLQNGNTIDIPVGDLISGLQSEITSTNKLASDLVDDTNQAHKFVSTSEKSTWNGKQDAITSSNKLAYSLVSGTPTNTSDFTNDGDGQSPFATESYVATNGGKIDIIKVNGTTQSIVNKAVDITVPTAYSQLSDDVFVEISASEVDAMFEEALV